MAEKATISYREFIQLVRSFRRTDALTACAWASAQSTKEARGPERDGDQLPSYHPFALAGIARAALCYGNDHRRAGITPLDVKRLCSAFVNIHDPFINDNDLNRFMVRTAHEQFPFQESPFFDVARTQALLIDTATAADSSLLTPGFWMDLLGCSLMDMSSVALMAHTIAVSSAGVLDIDRFDDPGFATVFDIVPRATIVSTLSTLFAAVPETHRELSSQDSVHGDLERYSFNPLRVHPFVWIDKSRAVAPVVPLVFYRATPGSLYFPAIKKHGLSFTNELGRIFEIYVGQQLALFPGSVLPQIEYNIGKDVHRSVDFFFVTDKAVVLVEAKATPMRADGRRGGASLEDDMRRGPSEAVDQITRTARQIRAAHPSFAAIPSDRPLIGLVVTLEPYYTVSTPSPEVPTWTASVRDLEQLVCCISKGLDDVLLPHKTPTATYPLTGSLRGLDFSGRNAILDRAWSKLPFSSLSKPGVGVEDGTQ